MVILLGIPGGSVHDTDQYPVVLHFGDGNRYQDAVWVVPSFPGNIPALRLSEIRSVEGSSIKVIVEGPNGFESGPHDATWIKGNCAGGRICLFLNNQDSPTLYGVHAEDDAIFVEPETTSS